MNEPSLYLATLKDKNLGDFNAKAVIVCVNFMFQVPSTSVPSHFKQEIVDLERCATLSGKRSLYTPVTTSE